MHTRMHTHTHINAHIYTQMQRHPPAHMNRSPHTGSLKNWYLSLYVVRSLSASVTSCDRLVVRTLRCGRSNPGLNPSHSTLFCRIFLLDTTCSMDSSPCCAVLVFCFVSVFVFASKHEIRVQNLGERKNLVIIQRHNVLWSRKVNQFYMNGCLGNDRHSNTCLSNGRHSQTIYSNMRGANKWRAPWMHVMLDLCRTKLNLHLAQTIWMLSDSPVLLCKQCTLYEAWHQCNEDAWRRVAMGTGGGGGGGRHSPPK